MVKINLLSNTAVLARACQNAQHIQTKFHSRLNIQALGWGEDGQGGAQRIFRAKDNISFFGH